MYTNDGSPSSHFGILAIVTGWQQLTHSVAKSPYVLYLQVRQSITFPLVINLIETRAVLCVFSAYLHSGIAHCGFLSGSRLWVV